MVPWKIDIITQTNESQCIKTKNISANLPARKDSKTFLEGTHKTRYGWGLMTSHGEQWPYFIIIIE